MPGKQVVAAIALIHDSEGKIFLQKRNDLSIPEAHGKWEFPGGGIEFGETGEEAVMRECREEMGCEVIVERFIPIFWTSMWKKENGEKFQAFVVCYQCRIATGMPRPSNQEVSQIGWFTKDEIRQMETLPGTHAVIAHA